MPRVFADHAVANWEGGAMDCNKLQSKREFQSLSYRVLASPGHVFKIRWWPQLITNVTFGAEL